MIRLAALLFLMTGLVAPAAPPTKRGAEIVAGENDAEWKKLFAALAGKGAVFSRFTERRWFPIRNEPVVLEGEMRLAGTRGLSLHYARPPENTVIMDERGLLIRDEGGREREVPPDPRAAALNTALLPVLRFDEAELAKTFVLHAARDGADWRLDFVPREPTLARMLGSIVVLGAGEMVRQLEFRRSGSQRVEIFIRETITGATFTDAELKRYFR